MWDRFEIPGNPTLKEFLDWFKDTHKLEVQMVSQGVSMLWSSFIAPKKAQDRMNMKMSELVEHVSKKPIPPHVKNLLVEVMVNDEDDEDVEVSCVRSDCFITLTVRSHMCSCISRTGNSNDGGGGCGGSETGTGRLCSRICKK